MTRQQLLAIGLPALLGMAGCAKSKSEGCQSIDQCRAGQICFRDTCSTVCAETSQCDLGNICEGGVCVQSTVTGDPPVITSVNGTGSVDGLSGHGGRHLKDRLAIAGAHLLNTVFSLTGVDPPTSPYPLVLCGTTTDSHVEVALPADVQPGAFVLTASNQAGACDASLSLLQGEPGSLDASGTQIVTAINEVLAADPTLSVRGAAFGQTSTFLVSGSVSTAADRSVLVNGQNYVTSTDTGLFLVTFDLDAHQVHDVAATIGYRSVANFRPSVPAEIAGLKDVLNTLATNHLVILASFGDVTPLLRDTALNTLLKSFGASDLIDAVATTQAYVLFGMKGIGGGNGLEQIAGAERGGLAVASSQSLGTSLLGLRRSAPHDARYINAAGDTMTGALIFQTDPTFNDNAIPATKINRTGLNADLVDGRQPTVPLYSCVASCPNGNCTCTSTGNVSNTTSVQCTGPSYTSCGSSGWGCCGSMVTSTCPCPTLMGYIMNP
jgi:hypothetical protein